MEISSENNKPFLFFFLVTCFCTAGTITLNTSIASVIQWFFNLFVYSSLQHLCRTEGVH